VAIKKKKYEKLDDVNIKRVIAALEAEQPVTKKEACEMLNISYNTTRLRKIIDNYNSDVEYRRQRMAKNRGKPVDKYELQEIIEGYLAGVPVIKIAKNMFRSPAFIKSHIDRIGVPSKVAEGELFIPPDECVKYEFEIGEWVWFNDAHPNAKGGKAGVVVKDITESSKRAKIEECNVYTIHYWTYLEWQEGFWISWWPGLKGFRSHTAKLAYDMASIQHLMDEYGIKKERL
jgi:hypothetical protein